MFRRNRPGSGVKLGVGVTTHNRQDVTAHTVKRWRALLPEGAVLVVVDDASDTPYPDADFRFEHNVGIARAKNKCLELLEDLGVDEFFLADNDCYPKARNWWKPYVLSPEPHLSYQFLDLQGPIKLHDLTVLYQDTEHTAHSGQRGCMLYYNKTCLKAVGGFDPIYGRALYEHSDLANRIHAAGLTSWRYADVTGSSQIWHSMDEWRQVQPLIDPRKQNALVQQNSILHNRRRTQDYQAFVSYREAQDQTEDLLITTLLTSTVDPKRGYKWSAIPDHLTAWVESVERNDLEGVILADELRKLPKGYTTRVVPVQPSAMNVYYRRWLHVYQYLRANPQLRWVWCTNGTDVEVLRDPFAGMAPGKLYCGAGNSTVNNPLVVKNHPAARFRGFFKEYGNRPLLSTGVVGGDRETLMGLAQRIVTVYNDIESERFWEQDLSKKDVGDMAAFNQVAWSELGSCVELGPHITTTFKSYSDNGTAKFRHK